MFPTFSKTSNKLGLYFSLFATLLCHVSCGHKSDADDNQQKQENSPGKGCALIGDETKGAVNGCALIGDELKGTIDGEPWSYKFGVARSNQIEGTWFVDLYDFERPADPCQDSPRPQGTFNSIGLFILKLELGGLNFDTPNPKNILSFDTTIRDHNSVRWDSKMASRAQGRIDTVTDKEITGYLEGQADNVDNFIKGTFSVTKCAPGT